MRDIQYFYRKAINVTQNLSYIDFMRCYEMVVNINDSRQAYHLWAILTTKINGRTFDSFPDFNYTVLDSIREHDNSYSPINLKRPLIAPEYPCEKRVRLTSTEQLAVSFTENVTITKPAKKARFAY
jgi:hypothetical protein